MRPLARPVGGGQHTPWPARWIALVGTLLCLALALWVNRLEAAREAATFEKVVTRIEHDVEDRFTLTTFGLKGAQAMFASERSQGRRVGREQFRAFVAARQIDQDFPGVRGFGFIERVDPADLERFEATQRAEGAAGFKVRQLDDKRDLDLYVIKYVEPLERNAAAMGLDVASERRRREALWRAVETGQPVITEPIALVQDGAKTPGFLIYVPAYRRDIAGLSPQERHGALDGVLYAPVVAKELLRGVVSEQDGVDLDIFYGDGTQALDATRLVFDNDNHLVSAANAGTFASAWTGRRHLASRTLDLLGRPFTLQITAIAGFDGGARPWVAWATFCIGTMLSLLLARLAHQAASGRARAEALAASMTADLDRLAMVARRTSDAVLIADTDCRITWVNEGFERLTGQGRDEVIGQVPSWFTPEPGADPRDVAALELALDRLQGFRGERRTRSREGRIGWISLEIQPLLDAQGQAQGFVAIASDITERRQAADALRASEELLERTGRIGHIGGWALDLQTQVLRWTDETCRIHDLPPGHQPTLDEGLAYYAEEWRPVIASAVRRAVEDGVPYDLELEIITARGRRVWVQAVGEVESRDGQALRLIGAFQDITERHQLENELRQRNETLASVLENLPCGLSVFDAELRLIASNRAYRALLGFPEELFQSERPRFEEFIRYNALRGEYGPGDPEAHVQTALHRAEGQVQRHQFERTRPDGTVLEVRGGPMPSGGFVTTYTDVTEQRRAEQSLRQRERLMRLVIDCFPGPLAHWDTELRCTLANRAYVEWMGLDPQAMVGRSQLELFGDAVYTRNLPLMQAALHGEVRMAERTRQKADGSTAHYLLWYHPDRDGNEVRGFVSTVVEVTEMKAAQLALEQRTAQAEEASIAKSQFVANMSHEIRTPMNAILGMLALLRRTDLSARQADYAAKTEGAARSLLGLLNEILDFSKVEAGKMELDPQPFSLERLLNDLSVIFSASTGAKPLEVLFDVGADVPESLVGDAFRLQQVLINLGGNALKFTERGEVVLSVRQVSRQGTTVRLAFAVRDTGIGIAPEHQDRIFAGFTQAEASTTRRYGGTGLGVAISQRIVALMGGDLRLESAPGVGTCFSFEIDLQALEVAVPARPETSRHVLIVDDNPLARRVLQEAARSLGWAAEAVEDGPSAVEALQRARATGRRFDGMFVDWEMPGMDGWQTVRALRDAAELQPHLSLVMVTAHGREELLARPAAEQRLIDGYLVKPVTPGMMAQALAGGLAVPTPTAAPVGLRPLSGLRLLVAEDNPNNQQVVRELLEDEGASVQIAVNGLVAVEAVASAEGGRLPFDLVLMDLQMPEMDGLEATRRIRALGTGAALPIVAMTANAMPADRDACLAAGMNAHVGKPFDLAELIEVILTHVGLPAAPLTPASRPAGPDAALPAPSTLAAAEAAAIDLVPALGRLGGREQTYRRLLDGFIADLGQMEGLLRQALGAGDLAGLVRSLHTAKGVAGTLGATALASAFAVAERSAADPAQAEHAVAVVLPVIEAARVPLIGLSAAMGPGDSAAATSPSTDPPVDLTPEVVAEIRSIAALLRDSDLAALEAVAALRGHWPHRPPDWLDPLDAAIQAMDFDAAHARCLAVLEPLDAVA